MPSKLCSLEPDGTMLFGKYSPSTKFTLFTIKKDFLKTSEAEGRAWVMNILSGHHYGVSSYTQAHNSVCIKIIWRKISWIISSHSSCPSHLFFKHYSHHYQSDVQAHQQTYKCQLCKVISTTNIPLWAWLAFNSYMCDFYFVCIVIGPRSDHCLPMSVTN